MNGRLPNGDAPKFVVRRTSKIEERNAVPVAVAADADLLCDASGAPVWPLRDEADRAALEAIAGVFEGALAEVPGEAVAEPGGSFPEVVLGIGDVAEEAALYAHLTGRSWEAVADVEAALGKPVPAVLLSLSPTVDPKLVELASMVDYGDQAPGIVWGRTRAELRRRVLVASAAATFATAAAVPLAEVVGGRMGMNEHPSDPDQLAKTLESRAGVLALFVHGDGFALELPAAHTMCVRLREDFEPDRSRAPECVYSGVCRLGMPVAEAVERERIIPPWAIAARVLVASSCQTVFVGGKAADPHWSVFPRLAANPRIGALLAPPQIFYLNVGGVRADIVEPLCEGRAVGAVLAAYDRRPFAKEVGGRFLLFGDPRTRATLPSEASRVRQAPQPPRSEVRRPSDLAAGAGNAAEVAMLSLIAATRRPETRPACEATGSTVLERIEELARASTGPEAEGAEADLRAAVLQHMATTKPRLSDAWGPEAEQVSGGSHMPCPYCGLRAQVRYVQLPGGSVRESFKCFACRDVMDHQAGSRLRPMVRLPEITLQGQWGGGGWAGTVLVVGLDPRQTLTVPWPADGNGAPVTRFSYEGDCPPGPVHVYAVFIDGLTVNTTAEQIAGAAWAGRN